MTLTELHLLLTYECNLTCAHCFVWGAPNQSGKMTGAMLDRILDQAEALGSIQWIYFEGGEPFLHYSLLLSGVEAAARRGFQVGLVTNGFWASGMRRAVHRLRPLSGLIQDLSISTDRYHVGSGMTGCAARAAEAAKTLGIPVNRIRIAGPGAKMPAAGESGLVFRGRAAALLSRGVEHHPGGTFTRCPHEDLMEPGRVHLDPLGWVHICQGITLGNFNQQPLPDLLGDCDPQRHPVVGPLLRGGPAELARAYGITPEPGYADACHFCYASRCQLRRRFPQELGPDQMYGVF